MMSDRSFADENLSTGGYALSPRTSAGANDTWLGEARFDHAARELTGLLGTSRLEPRVAKTLECLLAAPGEVVARDTLFAAIWPRGVVGDDSLNRLISSLRRALRDVGAGACVEIETIPRTGYRLRLAAPVEPTDRAHPTGLLERRGLLAAGAAAGLAVVGGVGLRLRPGPQSRDADQVALEAMAVAWETFDPQPIESARLLLRERFVADPHNAEVAGAFAIASADILSRYPRDEPDRILVARDVAEASRASSSDDRLTAQALAAWTADGWRALEVALDAAPRNRYTLASRFEFLVAVGRLREARAVASELLAGAPRSQRRMSAVIMGEMRSGNYPAAEAAIAQADRFYRGVALVWVQHFVALAMMGRFREALGRFERRAPGMAEEIMNPAVLEAWRLTLEALADPDASRRGAAVDAASAGPRKFYSSTPASLLQLALLQQEESLIALARDYFCSEYRIVRRVRVVVDPLVSHAMMFLWDPSLLPVRRSHDFAAIAKATGLVDYWRSGGRQPDDARAAEMALSV